MQQAAPQEPKGQPDASETKDVAPSDAKPQDDKAKPEAVDDAEGQGAAPLATGAGATASEAPAQPAEAAAVMASGGQVSHHHQTSQAQAGRAAEGSPSVDALNAIGGKAKPAGPEQIAFPEHAKARDEDAKAERSGPPVGTSPGEPGPSAKPGAVADQFAKAAFEPTAGAPQHAPSAPVAAAAPHGLQKPEAPVPVVAQVPLGSVPVEIGLKGMAGINRFEIRLDPVDLGRIDVRLDIDKDGGVKAHLSVDKVETLMLLQRDARTLERAFEQAGLKPSDSGVDLSLRDQQAQGQGRQEHGGDQRREGGRSAGPDIRTEGADSVIQEPVPQRIWRGAVGVDVRI